MYIELKEKVLCTVVLERIHVGLLLQIIKFLLEIKYINIYTEIYYYLS